MLLADLPADVKAMIVSRVLDVDDVLALRAVSMDWSRAFYALVRSSDISGTFPRATFLDTSRCSTCDRVLPRVATFVYQHDAHPKRFLFACPRRAPCFLKAVRRFLHDADAQGIYPFVTWTQRHCNVPRSSGGFSEGAVLSNSPLVYSRRLRTLCATAIFEAGVRKERALHVRREESTFVLTKSVPVDSVEATYASDRLFLCLFSAPFSTL